MADAHTDGAVSDDTIPENTQGEGPKAVPLEALKAEREKRQKLESELQALRNAEAERKRQAAEEAGEFKSLYEQAKAEAEAKAQQLDGVSKQLEALAERQAAALQRRLDALPEVLRDLVPDGLEQGELERQIERLEAKAPALVSGATPEPKGPGTRVGGTSTDPNELTAQEREWWNSDAAYNPNVSARVVKKLYARAQKRAAATN